VSSPSAQDAAPRRLLAGKLAAQGIPVNIGTPAAAQAFIEGQIDTWAKVVKANNIKAD
jgi:tripartite-type tricarboxylate transporter receptor subunit TctC